MAPRYNTVRVPSIPIPRNDVDALYATCMALKQVVDRLLEANPSVTSADTSAFLTDAPSDNVRYVRQNGIWVPE